MFSPVSKPAVRRQSPRPKLSEHWHDPPRSFGEGWHVFLTRFFVTAEGRHENLHYSQSSIHSRGANVMGVKSRWDTRADWKLLFSRRVQDARLSNMHVRRNMFSRRAQCARLRANMFPRWAQGTRLRPGQRLSGRSLRGLSARGSARMCLRSFDLQ